MNRSFLTIPVLIAAISGSACATKGFVKERVGDVNDKVETLGKSVEETQERTRQNEGKIGDVDQKAQAAQTAANAAASAAGSANSAAMTADQKAQAAHAAAVAAGGKADDLDKASRRLVFEVVLNEDQGNFTSGNADLPAAAKAKLDELVAKLMADPKDVYLEIEGYTDATGPKEFNLQLGLARAEAVKKYLYTEHQVPLHKMNVISYGPDNPVASNKTKDGRAQNRRVVIKVLA